MQPLNLPPAKLKLTRKDDAVFVWCTIRKKNLLLTPEEWVRQHIIHYLINEKKVPVGRMSSEHLVKINNQSRRCDIVVFGETANPLLIVECKAPDIQLSEMTFLQTSNYVQQLRTPYFWMTNGLQHAIAFISDAGFSYLDELTNYSEW